MCSVNLTEQFSKQRNGTSKKLTERNFKKINGTERNKFNIFFNGTQRNNKKIKKIIKNKRKFRCVPLSSVNLTEQFSKQRNGTILVPFQTERNINSVPFRLFRSVGIATLIIITTFF